MNYAAIATKTLGTIKRSGKSVILNRVSGGVHDPSTGLTTGGSVTPFPGFAVEVAFEQKLIAGSDVETNVKKLLVSFTAGAISPVVGSDTITVDGSDWKLLRANPVAPGSVVLYYEVEVS